jgi:hypothetical protein
MKLIRSVADAFFNESGIDLRKLPPTMSIDSIRFWAAELDSVGGDVKRLSPKLLRRMEHFDLIAVVVSKVVGEYRGRIEYWDRA